MITVFLKQEIVDHGAAHTLVPPKLEIISDHAIQALQLELPIIQFETSRNEGARMSAPVPDDTHRVPDLAPFIKRAALLPGEGATTILRIEVLDTGVAGRIEIDTSSGSAQVDQAAVDYARTLHWYAGRANGVPHSMWIRWGIRLQA